MAFRPRALELLADPTITLLADDPEFARLLVQRNALTRAATERREALELLAIQGELANAPSATTPSPRKQMLARRADALARKQPAAPAEPINADGVPPVIERALRIVAGETTAPEPDRAARLARLRNEAEIIDAALRAIVGMMDEVRADRSRAVAEALLPQHRAMLRSKLDAALAWPRRCRLSASWSPRCWRPDTTGRQAF